MNKLTANPHILLPDWPAPKPVRALVTLRTGGVSQPPFDSLNLGDHVEDEPEAVLDNRQRLADWAGLPMQNLQWLRQVHGVQVLDSAPSKGTAQADAVTTTQAEIGCIVMTADCLPVFLCDRQATQVAVAHAGWRGLVNGILEATLAKFPDPNQVLAWLGPAIGPASFEVGEEVRVAFVSRHEESQQCFRPHPEHAGHWLADLYELARLALKRQGVQSVSGGGFCTFADQTRFYSYRRDGRTGRMASLIWLQAE